MALSLAELEFEAGAVLPSRDTMFIFNIVIASVHSNNAVISVVNEAAGNNVTNLAGSDVAVLQVVGNVTVL